MFSFLFVYALECSFVDAAVKYVFCFVGTVLLYKRVENLRAFFGKRHWINCLIIKQLLAQAVNNSLARTCARSGLTFDVPNDMPTVFMVCMADFYFIFVRPRLSAFHGCPLFWSLQRCISSRACCQPRAFGSCPRQLPTRFSASHLHFGT